jgi:hypothetical protein
MLFVSVLFYLFFIPANNANYVELYERMSVTNAIEGDGKRRGRGPFYCITDNIYSGIKVKVKFTL